MIQAAEIMAKNRPMAVIWGSDMSPQAADIKDVKDLINLQMLMGNLGVSGGGVAPLRSQNNSQGAFDMGGHPSVFPGYQAVADEKARIKFEAAWGTELSIKAGLSAFEMLAAASHGSLKAFFILGENSWPEEGGSSIRRALGKCEFVVLCETLASEMSHYADVLLPGVSFAETTGTYTNTERRIQMVRQAIQTQGESKPEWTILSQLAQRLPIQPNRHLGDGTYESWDYADTAEIMDEIAALAPIYAGVSHRRLESGERLMWPVETAEHPGTEILQLNQFADGRGRFMPVGANSAAGPRKI
jgi:predicted molibdopterin-dependent oxidoreductase YjgC